MVRKSMELVNLCLCVLCLCLCYGSFSLDTNLVLAFMLAHVHASLVRTRLKAWNKKAYAEVTILRSFKTIHSDFTEACYLSFKL